jgi:predicted dehydrogenase
MLRGGVIGFGRMGLTHYSILNNHPEVNFVAVCDSSSFMLKNLRKHIGIETFEDYRKMIDKMDLDFVIIATPTIYHAEAIKYAIENDVHIFVEKPFTLNPAEASEIVDMLKEKNLVNQVGYVIRFSDVFLKVKDFLDSGMIGDVLSFKMEMYGPTLLKSSKSSWRAKRESGGGCLYDFASHSVDMINYLMGPPQEVVGSVLKSIYSANVEDAVSSTFIYPNNLSGVLLANWSDASYRKPSFRMELFGQEGKIIADMHAIKLFLKDSKADSELTKGWNTLYVTDFGKPVRFYVRGGEFTSQLDYFIDCVLKGAPGGICNFEDGLSTDIIMNKIFSDDSARSNTNG